MCAPPARLPVLLPLNGEAILVGEVIDTGDTTESRRNEEEEGALPGMLIAWAGSDISI